MTNPVPVRVRGELEVKVDDLPERAADLIKASLSFKNEDREQRAREQVPGWWNLPETIDLWREEYRHGGDHVLVMPRGFASHLTKGFAGQGIQIVWDDQRVLPVAPEGYFRPFAFDVQHDYQFEAVLAALRASQGFYECPAGGGKTVAMLGFAAYANTPTLVIVDKADLVEQWRERAFQFLGLGFKPRDDMDPEMAEKLQALVDQGRTVGKIGMSEWDEQPLTIALRQTLWSRMNELDVVQWRGQWGAEIYDEGHHLSADTLGEVARGCLAYYMLGTSATPARTPTQGKIVHSIVGPIIHITDRDLLRKKGILVLPKVEQVATEFDFAFIPTHKVDAGQSCQKPGCKKSGKEAHGHRNNYTTVVKNLTADKQRNALIASKVVAEPNRIHLVPSSQLKHLDAMKKAIEEAGWDNPIYYLRGEENARGESREIVRQIMEGSRTGCVILSTVADEGLDIPPIDRVHIPFPMRQEGATIQLVGRGERVFEGKDGCVIIDYVDVECEVLRNQSYAREKTYRKQAYPVTTLRSKEAIRFSSGDFSSFSTRWPVKVPNPWTNEEIISPTREHIFQALKATTQEDFDSVITASSASEAKQRGNEIKLRDDWEEVKFDVMAWAIGVQCHFHPDFKQLLLDTGHREIIEDRPDPVWGVGPDGNGQNLLGKALMHVRFDLQRPPAEATGGPS